jgi:hypothetical protein
MVVPNMAFETAIGIWPRVILLQHPSKLKLTSSEIWFWLCGSGSGGHIINGDLYFVHEVFQNGPKNAMPVETLPSISIKFPFMVPLSAKRATTLSPSALLQGGQQPDAMDISS